MAIFSNIYQKINQKQLNKPVIYYKLLMLFFPADRKITNQILVGKKKHEKTFTCFKIYRTKEAEVRDTFQWGWERDIILHFLKVEVLLQIDKNQTNT